MNTQFRCLWFPPQDGFFFKVLMKSNTARSEAPEIWKPYEKEEGVVNCRIHWQRFGVEKAFSPSMRCNLHVFSTSCSENYVKTAYNRLWKEGHIKMSLQDNNLIVYLSKMFSSCSYMKIKFSLPEIVYAVKCKKDVQNHHRISYFNNNSQAAAFCCYCWENKTALAKRWILAVCELLQATGQRLQNFVCALMHVTGTDT